MEKKKSEARRISLKFPAVCKACGKQLPVGTKVTWYPRGTVYGLDCHKSPFATAKPKAEKKVSAPAKQTPAVNPQSVDLTALVELLKAQPKSVQANFLRSLLGK